MNLREDDVVSAVALVMDEDGETAAEVLAPDELSSAEAAEPDATSDRPDDSGEAPDADPEASE